ncbi:hypothetical protein ACFL4G_07945 [Thermodesulfobacteriota bacterium]
MTLLIERIEWTRDGVSVTLRLEGKIAGSYVAEFENLYSFLSDEEQRTLLIDLEWISYVDEAGQDLLGRILNNGGQIIRSNMYIDNLLKLGNGTGQSADSQENVIQKEEEYG